MQQPPLTNKWDLCIAGQGMCHVPIKAGELLSLAEISLVNQTETKCDVQPFCARLNACVCIYTHVYIFLTLFMHACSSFLPSYKKEVNKKIKNSSLKS